MSQQTTNKTQEIKEAIIKTVAFFDLFDFPLTVMEIWKFLEVKCDLEEVIKILDQLLITDLENRNGYYFLPGRSSILIIRQERYRSSDRKFKKALKIAKIFRLFPWVKMIAVGNIIGAHNMKDGSDIDFFIITQPERVWLVRFFCASIAKALDVRPAIGRMRDNICLSFYISEKNLDLHRFLLPEIKDLYFTYWLAGLTPIYNREDVYNQLISANSWLNKALPNWEPSAGNYQRMIDNNFWSFIFLPIDWFFAIFEPLAKKYQLSILPEQIRSVMNQDNKVVVNDRVLKLHVNDRREMFSQNYQKKINEIFKQTN